MKHNHSSGKYRLLKRIVMMCMALILVCSVSISTFAVDRMSQVESGTTQSVQKTDNQNGETATTRQKSSEAETKTKQENTKKSDSESKTKENKDSSEEKQSDSKDVNDKGAKENSTQKEEKEKKEKSEKDTSKEEKSTKEETDTDKKTTDTTDASEATTKTAEEEKTESAEEKTTEATAEKTTESKNGEEETSEKKAEEETQAADAKHQKIQVAKITGPNKEVQVGKTITLTGTSGYYHSWSSSNENIATVTSYGSTATVTGVAVGKATITHTYGWNNTSETYEVTVTKFEDNHNGDAAIYYLANPTGDPWTNATGEWAPAQNTSNTLAQINTSGATWENGRVDNTIYKNKNIKSNVASYITSWPDSSTGATWTVKKDDHATGEYFDFILDSIWDNYKSSVAIELGIHPSQLMKKNITEITLTPRKISRDNDGTYPYHIDCSLSIKSTQVFTAKFLVKEPGGSEYTQVDAKNYKTGSRVAKTTKAEIGSTETVDGVTYVLDGWYPENEAGGAYGSPTIADTSWSYSPSDDELAGYTPTAAELADGTVNFYAHYSPITTSITIKKLVTGDMGDKQKEFAFTCEYSSYNATTKETETNTTSFNLKDGESTEIENVYIGSQFTVKETNAKGYTTSGSYNNAAISSLVETDKESSEKIAVVQIAEAGKNITIINNKGAIPDTGIASDVLPFITLFALSIAGIIGFLLYSYKKRFV